MVRFSIIIPCYNSGKYLRDTLNSVLKQNYNKFEIIIINDGSTDKTSVILEDFANFSRIKIFEKKNGGVSSARNMGIEKSTGEYILFLDADDDIQSNLLLSLDKFISDNNFIDIVSFGYEIIKLGGEKVLMNNFSFNEKVISNYEFLNLFFLKKINQCMCSFVVKSELIKFSQIKFNEKTSNGEDQEFQIKCLLNSKKVGYLSGPFFKYIMRDNSAVNSVFSEKYLSLIDVFIRLNDYIKGKVNDAELLSNFNRYSNLIFFYVFRKSIKSNNKILIKKVHSKNEILNYKFNYRFNKINIKLFFLKKIYFLNHKLLNFLFKLI